MKKSSRNIWISFATALIFIVTGCSAATTSTTAAGTAAGTKASGEQLNIMYIVQGSLGALGIEDIVKASLDDFAAKNNAKINIFECNGDASLYEPTLLDVAGSGEYDLIITNFYNFVEAVQIAAVEYPDQKIILLDANVDFADGKNKNVRTVQATQNEVSFLAGALAALMTKSDAEFANPEKVVGFVGAAENTAIQDFLIGYIEGVNYVDSQIKVIYSFVGNWTDTAKAKELALTQYRQGADVAFAVCGSAGLGVAEAAKEMKAYNIGVDYDFATAIKNNNPDTADHIITSAVKDFGTIITKELNAFKEGTVAWGTNTIYGFAQEGSNIVKNEYYEKLVPAAIKAEYEIIAEKLKKGEVKIGTSLGATQEQIDEFKRQAEPFTK